MVEARHLLILPDDLAERLMARYTTNHPKVMRPNRRPPKHLFSGLLVCAEFGSPCSIDSGFCYRCSANINRGPAICANGKYVRRDRVEEVILQAVFEEVFSPDAVAYLSGKVNDALARLAARPSEARQRLQAELDQARTKLENVKAAILDGIRTPTTRTMLEEWEGDRLEAALAVTTRRGRTSPSTQRRLRAIRGT